MKKVILLMLIVMPGLVRAQRKVVANSQLIVAPLYPLIHKTSGMWLTKSTQSFVPSPAVVTTPKVVPPVGPRDYYQQRFGYFCKREWNLEKQTRVPVKFRLGSYQEAQRIEGKQ